MTFEEAQQHYPIEHGDDGCWVWHAARTKDDYGCYFEDGGLRFAHRELFRRRHGVIPAGARLDHRCRNRSCVNPDHLEPVTNRENTLRGQGPTAVNARKTHCVRGHAYDAENTTIRTDGSRRCRACYGPKLKR